MPKTKPIGVRFTETLLNDLKVAGIALTPQKALNLYERTYIDYIDLKIANNNLLENKDKILKERDTISNVQKQAQYPLDTNEFFHSLYKKGDPPENSIAFYMKYDCNNYQELEQNIKKQ